MESARYVVQDPLHPGKWKSVTWNEFHANCPKVVPGKGLVEFMAQTLCCHTVSHDGQEHTRRLLLPPTIMKHGTASVTYSAVEIDTPGLTMEKLKEFAATHPIVTVSEVPDNSTVNVRKKAFTASELPRNVLYTPLGCSAHLLNRVIVSSIGEDDLVGHCHAIFVVTRHPASRAKLMKEACAIIDEEFDMYPGPPPQEWNLHLQRILEHTLLRRLDHTTGSILKLGLLDDCPKDLSDGLSTEVPFSTRRNGAALVHKFCNGNPRVPKVVHYCSGCCSSREDALANAKAAVMQGGLLGGFASVTPSKGRHGSTTEAMGEQSAGCMCFNILPRAMERAFPKWQSAGDVSEDAEDKRAYLRSKTWRAKLHLSSQAGKVRGAITSWAAEPIDYLWMRLQYLDGRESSLFDLQVDSANPFEECQRSLSSFLLDPVDATSMRTVFEHYGSDRDAKISLALNTQELVACMVCQIYVRFGIQ